MSNPIIEKYNTIPVQVKASFWFLICSFLQKGISVLTTPIFTRLLTTAEYGQFTVFNSWLSILSVVVTMNMAAGIYMQAFVKFSKDRNVLSSSLQGLTFVLVCIWTVIYLLAFRSWNHLFSMTTTQCLLMLLVMWTTAVFGFWSVEQRVLLSYKRLIAVTLTVSFANPALGIWLITCSEDKVTARILGIAIAELLGYGWCFVDQIKRGGKFFSARFWKYGITFAVPLIPHYLAQTVLNGADRIMIEHMVGNSEAGIYGLAYSISMVMTLFNSAALQTLGPWIYQKIHDRDIEKIGKIAYPTLGGIAVLNLLLILFAPEIVAIFAPPSYREAIWIIPPVAMSVYFIFAYDLFAKVQFYFEKKGFIMVASLLAAVLNVILNLVFIRIFGYYAAGYTTLACFICYTGGHYYFMRRLCAQEFDGVQIYDTKRLLIQTGLFIGAGSGTMLLYPYPYLRYALIALIGILVCVYHKKIIGFLKKITSKEKN